MSQPKGIRKKHLQCPFTWQLPVSSDDDLKEEEDVLPLSGNTWSLIISKLALAYQYLMRDDAARSKMLIVECYIPLLSLSNSQSSCELINTYRVALKHVIDSTWAFVCCKSTSLAEVEPFLQTIAPFDRMDAHQRAAIWAIRAKILNNTDALIPCQIAVDLDPKEGQWHLYKGALLFHKRNQSNIATAEELRELEIAYALRQTPETTVHLAVSLTQQHRKPRDVKKGRQMLREASKKWPDNVFVNLECGMTLFRVHSKPEDIVQAEKYLRNALKLANDCMAIHHALGMFLLNFRDKAEGRKHLRIASSVYN